jgi:hypothetical protein
MSAPESARAAVARETAAAPLAELVRCRQRALLAIVGLRYLWHYATLGPLAAWGYALAAYAGHMSALAYVPLVTFTLLEPTTWAFLGVYFAPGLAIEAMLAQWVWRRTAHPPRRPIGDIWRSGSSAASAPAASSTRLPQPTTRCR